MLPVLTKIDSRTGESSINFKYSPERVFLRDLKEWRIKNLPENPVVKRTKLFKTV
jgi:hypothetical protein